MNTNREQLTLLDMISIMSFVVGLQNLDMNITQEDVQKLEAKFDSSFNKSLEDIHSHLAVQDVKLNHIIKLLEEKK